MKNRIFAGAAAAVLALVGVLGVSAPASAHTSKVTGVAVCEADGTYSVEWTYNATNVPNGVEAETKAMTTNQGSLAPIDGVNKGGQIFLSVWSQHQINVPGAPVKTGNWSAKFKTVGIPGTFSGDVTTMVQTDWLNGPSEDPVGKVTVKGDCKTPPVKVYPPVITPVAPSFTTAATCDTDGTYTLPAGPAAQTGGPGQDHGVELDGYRLYVQNTTGTFGGPGAYTWQAYGIGAAGNAAYPNGTSVGGKVDSQGNPKAGGMISGTFTVDAKTGDCPIPENPGPKVVFGDWETGKFECGDTTVKIHRTVTSTEQVWNGSAYVDGNVISATQTDERNLTQEEIDSLECEVVTPPTEEPPVTEPPTTVEPPKTDTPKETIVTTQRAAVKVPAELAETGLEPGVIGIGIGTFIALSGLGAWLLVAGGKKRAEINN